MSSIVWYSPPVKFAFILRKIKSSFALDFALRNPPQHPNTLGSRVEWSSICFLIQQNHFLLHVVLHKMINSYAVNMRTLIILSILLYSCLKISYCKCFIKVLSNISIWILSQSFQLIGKKLKNPVYISCFSNFILPVHTCH